MHQSTPVGIGHVRCINILTWLRGFRVKIVFSFCLSVPKRDSDTKKTIRNIEICPESLRAIECRHSHASVKQKPKTKTKRLITFNARLKTALLTRVLNMWKMLRKRMLDLPATCSDSLSIPTFVNVAFSGVSVLFLNFCISVYGLFLVTHDLIDLNEFVSCSHCENMCSQKNPLF